MRMSCSNRMHGRTMLERSRSLARKSTTAKDAWAVPIGTQILTFIASTSPSPMNSLLPFRACGAHSYDHFVFTFPALQTQDCCNRWLIYTLHLPLAHMQSHSADTDGFWVATTYPSWPQRRGKLHCLQWRCLVVTSSVHFVRHSIMRLKKTNESNPNNCTIFSSRKTNIRLRALEAYRYYLVAILAQANWIHWLFFVAALKCGMIHARNHPVSWCNPTCSYDGLFKVSHQLEAKDLLFWARLVGASLPLVAQLHWQSKLFDYSSFWMLNKIVNTETFLSIWCWDMCYIVGRGLQRPNFPLYSE